MYWDTVVIDPLAEPKWMPRCQPVVRPLAKVSAVAPSSPAPAPVTPELQRKREMAYEQLHRAIIKVCQNYPGLTTEIAHAIRPFNEDPIWHGA